MRGPARDYGCWEEKVAELTNFWTIGSQNSTFYNEKGEIKKLKSINFPFIDLESGGTEKETLSEESPLDELAIRPCGN